MKSTILIISLLIYTVTIAQQPVIPLYGGSDLFDTPNAYYKDTYDDLTELVGTWQYSNNNEEFTIKLQKKYMHFRNSEIRNIQYYKDFLYGEYKYVNQNGVIINNSLNDMQSGFTNYNDYEISGNRILGKYNRPICNECAENERRVKLYIYDSQRDYFFYAMFIRHIPKLGQPDEIKIIIKNQSHIVFIPENQPSNHRLPVNRELTLTKVE